jgi:hypothetical protein
MVVDPSRLPRDPRMLRLLPALGVVVLAVSTPLDARAQACEPIGDAGFEQAAKSAPIVPREDELPWCVSADDPRCAPLHGSPRPVDSALRRAAGMPCDVAPPTIEPNSDLEFGTRVGLIPHDGVSQRVERPPRPVRRLL